MNNQIDSMDIGKALKLFPEQIKRTFKQALESKISEIVFDSVVVSGMGGSSNAGKIIQSWQEKSNDKLLTTHNGYELPDWVNKKTLVILNSYSGNTEETLSSYEPAKKAGCVVVGLTTGGKVKDLIDGGKIKGAIISAGDTNPSGYPKSGLGLSLGGLLGVLVKVGYLDLSEEKLVESLSELIEIRNSWDAKKRAEWLNGYMPVLFASRALLGPLNAGRNAMCEISRVFSQYYDFPEVNHVLVEATQQPVSAVKNLRYLFFESNQDHERITLRYRITKEIFDQQGLTYQTYKLKGSTKLVQSLELAHYCAWVGFYMSILRGVDPGPEPWIVKLKESLSQPVH